MESNNKYSESLELFFNTFVDTDLNDEINLLQWIDALKSLSFDKDLSEKEMMKIFYHIDIDQTGFMDCVDFVLFCTATSLTGEIKGLHAVLNTNLQSHEFIIKFSKLSLSNNALEYGSSLIDGAMM
eukprot:859181_1